jgi:hypothetical protein
MTRPHLDQTTWITLAIATAATLIAVLAFLTGYPAP